MFVTGSNLSRSKGMFGRLRLSSPLADSPCEVDTPRVVRLWRVLAMSTLVAVVGLGAAWSVYAAQQPRHATAGPAQLQRALQQEVGQLVAGPRGVRPTSVPLPGSVMPRGGVCFVAASSCSEIPCVQFVHAGGGPATVSIAARLERPIAIPRLTAVPDLTAVPELDAGPGLAAVPRITTVPRLSAPLLGSTCAGRLGTPRTLRVGIP